jgi:hypothetical protein
MMKNNQATPYWYIAGVAMDCSKMIDKSELFTK